MFLNSSGLSQAIDKTPQHFEKVSKEVLSTFQWFVKEAVNDVTWSIEDWLQFQDESGYDAILMLFNWASTLYRKSVFIINIFIKILSFIRIECKKLTKEFES